MSAYRFIPLGNHSPDVVEVAQGDDCVVIIPGPSGSLVFTATNALLLADELRRAADTAAGIHSWADEDVPDAGTLDRLARS